MEDLIYFEGMDSKGILYISFKTHTHNISRPMFASGHLQHQATSHCDLRLHYAVGCEVERATLVTACWSFDVDKLPRR